jgi:ferric-dicitrate binding protein FerR (iron transport regulator)
MSIERLIRFAGEREVPSQEAVERARLAAEAAWRRGLEPAPARSRWRQAWLPLACAAAVGALVLLLHPGLRREPAPPIAVAQLVTLQGDAVLQGGASPLTRNATIFAGSTLVTGDGRLAASVPGGLSLRMDRHTRLGFVDREHLVLLEGSLYVDSGGLNSGPALSIRTPAGDVSPVGTQFQVQVVGQTTRVRVREGRVALIPETGTQQRVIAAGDALEVSGGAERWQHGLASFGDDWEWATTLAQPLVIEDRPLAEFLAWLAREHGWQLRYGSGALQQRTLDIRLHGSFDGLDTSSMLERVGLVTGVPLVVRDGSLWVGAK